MDQSELVYLSAVELSRLFRERALSPVEVVEATLAQIEAVDQAVRAFVTVTADIAREQARGAERAFSAGEPRLLEGIPFSIKDLTPTRGIRTTRGSLLFKDWVPDFDALPVERAYAAGGVLLGKTNTPEFGWKGDAGNRVFGATHNPWRLELTPGGSSGGAAAAVAAGMGPLAHGTDAAGSIRSPAFFCGVFGLKPSLGLVPFFPPAPIEAMSHTGPITRTVRDAALFLTVMAGPDARDPASLSGRRLDYLTALEVPAPRLRVAWSPRLGGDALIEPEIERVLANAASVFSELGLDVDEVQTPFGDPSEIAEVLLTSATAAAHAEDLDQVRDLIDPGRLALVEKGLKISGPEVASAYIKRAAFRERVRAFLDDYDVLVTPTMPCRPFPAGDDQPRELCGRPQTNFSWTPFTYPFNITGNPAANVPWGFTDDGLPVGIQIVGRLHGDLTVLQLAAMVEEARPWAGSYPPTAIRDLAPGESEANEEGVADGPPARTVR